jgi:hypothetical protein
LQSAWQSHYADALSEKLALGERTEPREIPCFGHIDVTSTDCRSSEASLLNRNAERVIKT